MEYPGHRELRRMRLEALIDQLHREIRLAAPYPDVQARLVMQLGLAERTVAALSPHASPERFPPCQR